MAPAFVCFLIPALVPAKKRDVVGPVGERSNFKKIPTHMQDHGDA